MSQPNLYKKPPRPGYLGSYNWSAVVVGLLILVLANFFCTQYIANQFRYQPALGPALVRLRAGAIYEPFAWARWGWQHMTDRDPAIRGPFLQGMLVLLAGSFLCVGAFFAMTNRRARQLSKNTEHLHGSARWAEYADILASGLLTAEDGVYVGGWSPDGKRLNYLRHNGPEHVLAFAPTRSGKGVSLVIPTLLAWSESAIIYDIKGENWAKTSGFRAQAGHICLKFSPVEENVCTRFNPLSEVRLFTARDVSDAQNIANMLVQTGEDPKTEAEAYFQNTACSLTSGLILHVCYAAARESRQATLAELYYLYTRPGESFRDTLTDLLNYPHDPDRKHGWTMPNGAPTATHPVVRQKAQEMLNKYDRDFSGVLSTASTALAVYCDPLVASNTAASDFTINDLVNHERPISLYLVVPSSDKVRLRPLIRLMFTLTVNRLTERMEFAGTEQQYNRHRLFFLIDEFPSLNRMEIFADALSYMAGYGLKAYLVTQDIRQIVKAYGENESIVSNCHVRVAFAPNQQDTAKLLSEMTGTTTVQKATYNFSGQRLSPVMGHVNASVDNIERPLLTPDEVQRLKAPKKKGSGDKERIVAPGQMLIFVSGQYPILGTQMLYFFDPVFKMRSEIRPPEKFPSLQTKPASLPAPAPVQTTPPIVPERPEALHGEDAYLAALEEMDECENEEEEPEHAEEPY
ncbi:MAG TPA: type IV secretory system conjugative DNA transfer family protein [Bryobacteraceae bacterium]|jgi:type IV secretion system protein VirD4